MDKLHQNILQQLRRKIVLDMDVFNGIIQPLKSDYILTEQDILRLEACNSKENRAEILLDILPSRGPDAFDKFRRALRRHYEWLSEDMDKLEESEKTVTDIRYNGTPTLPPVSPLTVIREQKNEQLKDCLEKLQPNEYVVLHGMKGFGKSCLTASTLKDTKFVGTSFHNAVYWIKFGYTRPVKDEILIQLNRLYHLVKNLEMLPETFKPEPLKEALIHFLKHHFSQERNSHALLILDDVCNAKMIEEFDFECKTLVITADRDLVSDKRPFVIEMNDGFTEAESLGLFAKVLETEVDKLPLEAKRIHEESKGMPLLIAMFSAQFEEFKHDMKLGSHRWKYYLDSLRNKDEKNHVIKKFLKKQEAIFDICIEQLPPEMKRRYDELVIFREDINIMPQTLEILWGGVPFQVEEMMLELCHKSLAAKQWNDELHSYIYGVHDLLLCHLRKKFSKEELVNMHKSLIEKYRTYCNGDFSKLPADNYSYSYIGYHLKEAQLYDEFPNIYLNFDFIQATIIHSGLSNLLIDLENYRKYITKNFDPVLETHLTDLKKFLEEQASVIAKHRYKKCLDIVQIAMNHPYEGFIKDTAMKLAKERVENLYILHDKRMEQMNIPQSEEMSTIICTTCFTNNPNLILVGNEVGEIFLWNSISKRQTVFSGNNKNSRIKKIVMSPNDDYFLSLDDQGVVRLFRLSDDENYDENSIGVLIPRQRQSYWSGIFRSQVHHDDSSKIFFVEDEIILDVTFAQDSNYIAACTNKGTIKVWDCCGQTLSNFTHNLQSISYLKKIVFSDGCNLLHIMDETHGVLISYRRSNSEYRYLSQYNPSLEKRKIIFLHNIPNENNSLIVVSEDKAVYIKWFESGNEQMHSYNKQTRANVENKNTVYVCGALTYDGQYLVLADSSGFINICKADSFLQPVATYKSHVSSLDTYWLKEEGHHIICGSENQLLHKWELPVGISKSATKPLFDAAVQSIHEPDTIVTESFSNTIVTLVGNDIVAESKPIIGKINNLILSPDKKKIVFTINEGTVSLFDIDNKETIHIFQDKEFIKIINIENNNIIICREKDDHLRIWQNNKVTYIVENTGFVISIHEVNTRCVVTVTRNSIIKLWSITGTNWLQIDRVGGSGTTTIFSCLSYCKNILAVLNENGDVILYNLQEDTIHVPASIKITEYFKKKYTQKSTCCKIAQNEQYLAIGFENGDISIIDISLQAEIRKLSFHTASITQLHWAPSTVNVPVLLSVNPDELAWWNISFDTHINKQKRIRSKMNRSASSPLVGNSSVNNMHLSTSQSVGSDIYSAQRQLDTTTTTTTNGVHGVSKYWKLKKGKDSNRGALLAVVELPSNFLAKVCVSTDFTKFVTVDIYGSISTFSVCGYD